MSFRRQCECGACSQQQIRVTLKVPAGLQCMLYITLQLAKSPTGQWQSNCGLELPNLPVAAWESGVRQCVIHFFPSMELTVHTQISFTAGLF